MDLVMKILQSLLPAWHTKAIVIKDSKNLSTLTLEELIRSLMTYELNMHSLELEPKKSKGIALKAYSHKHDTTSEDESSTDDAEEELALLTRRMKKIFRKRRPNSFNYERKMGRSNPL